MDQELITYLDQRFRENAQQIASLREETLLHFERVEEAIRHTRVEVEGLRGEVRLLAEGIASVEERKERDPVEVIRERFGLGKGPFSS